MNYYVYIIRCSDDSLYTGITTDINRRVDEHNGIGENLSAGAKYTATRRPVKIVYLLQMKDRSSASKEEFRIKILTKKQKEEFILSNN